MDIYSLKHVFEKYQPSKINCGPTVNTNIVNAQNRSNLEIACIITDYKNIFYTEKPRFKLDILLKYFIKEKNIKTCFYYRYYLTQLKIINNQLIVINKFSKKKNKNHI